LVSIITQTIDTISALSSQAIISSSVNPQVENKTSTSPAIPSVFPTDKTTKISPTSLPITSKSSILYRN
jgi:hypothetical protein